jgi:hypothetical protein
VKRGSQEERESDGYFERSWDNLKEEFNFY